MKLFYLVFGVVFPMFAFANSQFVNVNGYELEYEVAGKGTEIKDMPVTVITSVKKMENPPNLFFTDQGRKMWGELWQSWTNAFPQGKSVLTEKSGHFVQFDEPDLVITELLALMKKLEKQR